MVERQCRMRDSHLPADLENFPLPGHRSSHCFATPRVFSSMSPIPNESSLGPVTEVCLHCVSSHLKTRSGRSGWRSKLPANTIFAEETAHLSIDAVCLHWPNGIAACSTCGEEITICPEAR